MRPRSIQDVVSSKEYSSTQRGSRGAARVRGLRDVMLGEKMTDRAIPATHAKRLGEIAWLDREAERLGREANIVQANLERIQSRLAEIADYRESLLVIVRDGLRVVSEIDPQADEKSTSGNNRVRRSAGAFNVVAVEY
jgi:hypothetical protein